MTIKQNCVVSFLNIIENIKPDLKGCINWPMGISGTGYGVYSIGNMTYCVPRLIYKIYNPHLDASLVIRHKCDNRACCNIDHLESGTQSDNLMDASKRKRLKIGEQNHKCRLTDIQVIEIRNSYPDKSTVELGKIYNMAPGNIRDIIIGKTWSHIGGAKPLKTYNRALGEKMGRSKLIKEQVLEIRCRYPKETKAKLSRAFGVGHAMICRIVNRNNWKHI